MTMKTVIGGLVLALESIIIHSMGYAITTWQWWAVFYSLYYMRLYYYFFDRMEE